MFASATTTLQCTADYYSISHDLVRWNFTSQCSLHSDHSLSQARFQVSESHNVIHGWVLSILPVVNFAI